MTTTNTFGVRFIPRTRKTKPQDLLLVARLTVRKKVAEISRKKTMAAECWNQTNEFFNGNKKLAFKFKNLLEEVKHWLSLISPFFQHHREYNTKALLKGL